MPAHANHSDPSAFAFIRARTRSSPNLTRRLSAATRSERSMPAFVTQRSLTELLLSKLRRSRAASVQGSGQLDQADEFGAVAVLVAAAVRACQRGCLFPRRLALELRASQQHSE